MTVGFLAGVVEGFYGQPWTQTQRLRLFDQMSQWGLNTYCYAPKDDLKHRAIWRECYTPHELAFLSDLIRDCASHNQVFVYGLSPGLDIRFSDGDELAAIKRRFDQLIGVGARHFALLFDDLQGEMHADDREAFSSVAHAQCHITNSVFQWLTGQFKLSRMLFCPTPYCDRMDRWQLAGKDYLTLLGQNLAEQIDVLWTGPEIISSEIPVRSIERLRERIGRKPIIWDNLHANDYDLRRLYCGPYAGRSAELLSSIGGILTNPNNEFPVNEVPLRTLAEFVRDPAGYDSREAYLSALAKWHRRFETVGSPVSKDDLQLLADCYYLPHEEGPAARRMLQVIDVLLSRPAESWQGEYVEFLTYFERIQRIFDGLTRLTDRELFYAWSRRVWELNEELELVKEFLVCKQAGGDERRGASSETHLPGTYRGGVVSKLQQRLTMGLGGRFRASHAAPPLS